MSRSALGCAGVSAQRIALVFALFSAPVARAQVVALGVAAGATVPAGSYADANNVGYHVFLTLDAHARLSPIGLRVDGMFNELNPKSGGEKDRVLAGTGNLVVNTMGSSGPYLIGGGGLYNRRSGTPFGTFSRTDWGVNIGAGIRLPLTGFSTFAEVRYHKGLNGSQVQMIPITFGIMF